MIVGGHSVPPPASVAVVRVGNCSGVLVQPSIVLSSGHCLQGHVDQVVVGGQAIPVAGCQTYPGYQSPVSDHDIGFCRLATPAQVAGIAVDAGPALTVGAAVTLAGFGLQHAFALGTGVLQFVNTRVARVGVDSTEVGDHDHTACRGDSGGPVLLNRHGNLFVAGIIHGGSGAICASPTLAVPILPHLAWLLKASTDIEDQSSGHVLGTLFRGTRLRAGWVSANPALFWQGDPSRFREPNRARRAPDRSKPFRSGQAHPDSGKAEREHVRGPPEVAHPEPEYPSLGS